MFPYFLLFPVWLLVAIALPLVQTLHALQVKSEDRKLWLFYWMTFVAGSWVLYYFGWLLQLPFYVLAFYVDLYHEFQILVVFYLVFPPVLGIKVLQSKIDTHASAVGIQLKEKVQREKKVVERNFLTILLSKK